VKKKTIGGGFKSGVSLGEPSLISLRVSLIEVVGAEFDCSFSRLSLGVMNKKLTRQCGESEKVKK